MSKEALEKFIESGQKINLGNLFPYLQDMAEAMTTIIRWEIREKIGGQSARENDLHHTFKMTFMTIALAARENALRKPEDQLNIGELATTALVHDLSEFIKGDQPYFLKMNNGGKDDIEEFAIFEKIIKPLWAESQEYFIEAMARAMPEDKEHYIDSPEARFFNAMERLDGLERGIHECNLGYMHFAPKCLELHLDDMRNHSKEFPSLKDLCEPYVEQIEQHLQAWQEKKEEYRANFIANGGKEEEFNKLL